jgi:hypothetical protein
MINFAKVIGQNFIEINRKFSCDSLHPNVPHAHMMMTVLNHRRMTAIKKIDGYFTSQFCSPNIKKVMMS